MPALDPADALQVGVYGLLTSDATLVAMAGVFDGPPEGVAYPYVVIGEMTSTPEGVHGVEGRETVVTVHTWARSRGMKAVNDVGARVVRLLHHRHADLNTRVSGHRVWRVSHEFAHALDDPEPELRHRVDRFRVWTSQEA